MTLSKLIPPLRRGAILNERLRVEPHQLGPAGFRLHSGVSLRCLAEANRAFRLLAGSALCRVEQDRRDLECLDRRRFTLHSVPENDNVKMNAVIHVFGGIADGCNCAIDLCHHTRKLLAGTEEYSSDDGRGASAVRDGVRGSRVLNSISREEARKAGIEEQERLFYFRVDRGKANYLPPAASATWRKFENVELLNHDQVGVVTEWDFQETRIALSDDACEQVQAEVAVGTYREHKQRSPERWVGRLVAKHLGLNPNEEKNDWKIRRGIRDLENREVIIYEMRKMADDYREVSYAAPGPWKKGSTT